MNAPVRKPAADLAWLEREFDRLRGLIEEGRSPNGLEAGGTVSGFDPAHDATSRNPLETLRETFDLSPFECDLLVLCAGLEMDAGLAEAWSRATGQAMPPRLGAGDALRVLPGGRWDVFSPRRPLLRWRLVELGDTGALTSSRLRIAERVLRFLMGVNELDGRLRPLFRPAPDHVALPPGHETAVSDCTRLLATASGPALLLQWIGDDELGQEDAATALARAFGLRLHVVNGADLPAEPSAALDIVATWEREGALLSSALLIDLHHGPMPPGAMASLEDLRGLVMLAGKSPLTTRRRFHCCRIDRPSAREQRALWSAAMERLPESTPVDDGELDVVASTFRLSTRTIRSIAAHWGACAAADRRKPSLHLLCREQRRVAMDDLAERIEPGVGWNDLVLPPAQTSMLRQVAAHVRHRMTVLYEWGFAEKGGRGLGTSALFCGESGTGKTMACEVLARELQLDLYRIDLSAVVSKYIGETEKNLSRIFDAADGGGILLLFDEADALFGKRSEVKDSHDRYANIEIAYLLQRIESYRGIAVLTTNMRSALDAAFTRRLRFIVQFPFPDAPQRERIWRTAFPPALPQEGIDLATLAQVRIAGGQIRNVALSAAFLAAEQGRPLNMSHVLEATHMELAKQERRLSEADTRGWR